MTKPFMSSLCLTISIRSNGTLATAPQLATRCSRYLPTPVRARGTNLVGEYRPFDSFSRLLWRIHLRRCT
jgi:hypothetical protein